VQLSNLCVPSLNDAGPRDVRVDGSALLSESSMSTDRSRERTSLCCGLRTRENYSRRTQCDRRRDVRAMREAEFAARRSATDATVHEVDRVLARPKSVASDLELRGSTISASETGT